MDAVKKFAILRVIFGVIWAIDAFFKWQPDFFINFTSYLTGGAEGQSLLVQRWIHGWISLVGVDPHFFALFVAIAETAIATGLILGIFTPLVCSGGIIFSLVIWSTAEGFGGPYTAGSTDIGSAVIYALVFAALLIGRCWTVWSLDALRKDNKRNDGGIILN